MFPVIRNEGSRTHLSDKTDLEAVQRIKRRAELPSSNRLPTVTEANQTNIHQVLALPFVDFRYIEETFNNTIQGSQELLTYTETTYVRDSPKKGRR